MEVVERFSKNSIYFLNSLTYGDVCAYLPDKMTIKDKKKYYEKIKSFCKAHIKAKCEIKRLYKHSFKNGEIHEGRLFSSYSVQNIPKDFRAILCRDISTDIDQSASHPTILRFLCKKNNILTPNLDYFINNRDDIYESLDLPRDEAKKLFLKSVNTDTLNRHEKNKFFKDFDKEIKYIHKELFKLDNFKDYLITAKQNRTYNFYGSAINCILCVYENKILNEMVSVVNINNIEILALMFDGLMIYGNHYENKELLNEMEAHINNVFEGLNMKLTYKKHSDAIIMPKSFDINELDDEIENIKNDPLFYDNFKMKFEETHFKIINTSSYIKLIKNGDFVVMSRKHLFDAYEHLKCKTIKLNKKTNDYEVLKAPFIELWAKDEYIKQFENVDLYPPPLKCPDNVYNLWTGFEMEKIENYTEKPDELQFILNHIKILCNHEESVYDYFIKWIGQMIQYPAVKTTCPIFISEEGAGKGRFLELLTRMMGKSKVFETTRPSEHVWGKFNPAMNKSFFISLNELGKQQIIGYEDHLKSIITDESMIINDKGQKAYKIKSFHRLCGFTNNSEPIPLPKDTRRFFVCRSSDEKIGDVEYFDKLSKMLEDDDVIKTCFEYFKNITDLNNFRCLKLPQTEYAKELMEMKIDPVELWFKYYISTKYNENEYTIKQYELFDIFKIYLLKNMPNYVNSYNPVSFGIRLNRLKIDGIEKKKRNFGNIISLNIDKIYKHYNIDKNECMIESIKDEEIEEDNSDFET